MLLDPVGDHRSPGRVRRLDAGAEVRQAGLEQDRVGEDQRDEHDDRRGEVRQDLAEHDPQRGSAPAERAASMNSRSRSAEHLAADRLGDVGDVDEADDERGHQQRVAVQRTDPAERERRRRARRRGVHRDRPRSGRAPRLMHAVDDAAEVAGDDPEDRREDHRDQRRDAPDLERVAPAVEQPHGHVAAVGVGAEEELRVPRRPDRDPDRADDVVELAADLDLLGDVVVVRARCARCRSSRPAPAGTAPRSAGTAPPKNSATLLRRSRRQASLYGPIPGGSPSSLLARQLGGIAARELGAGRLGGALDCHAGCEPRRDGAGGGVARPSSSADSSTSACSDVPVPAVDLAGTRLRCSRSGSR